MPSQYRNIACVGELIKCVCYALLLPSHPKACLIYRPLGWDAHMGGQGTQTSKSMIMLLALCLLTDVLRYIAMHNAVGDRGLGFANPNRFWAWGYGAWAFGDQGLLRCRTVRVSQLGPELRPEPESCREPCQWLMDDGWTMVLKLPPLGWTLDQCTVLFN